MTLETNRATSQLVKPILDWKEVGISVDSCFVTVRLTQLSVAYKPNFYHSTRVISTSLVIKDIRALVLWRGTISSADALTYNFEHQAIVNSSLGRQFSELSRQRRTIKTRRNRKTMGRGDGRLFRPCVPIHFYSNVLLFT